MNTETVGRKSLELLQKEVDTRDPIELEREMHKRFEKDFWERVDLGRKEFYGDFYIVVITKKEPLMQNVLRNYFIARLSCPTPEWDQSVYKYKREVDVADYLWTIPDKQTCELILRHKDQVPKEEKLLLHFIENFYRGKLLELAKKLNNEKKDSNLLNI